MTVARRRLIDRDRRRRTGDGRRAPTLALLAEGLAAAAAEPGLPDQRLGLLFACAHPALDRGIRAPLMLQVVLGLDAGRIASAFLDLAGGDGQAAGPRQGPASARPASPSPSPSPASSPPASTRCSRRSTPPSPRAGPTPPAPTPPAAS